jgi:hypothetical protein
MLRTVENLIPHECSWEAPIFTPAMLTAKFRHGS